MRKRGVAVTFPTKTRQLACCSIVEMASRGGGHDRETAPREEITQGESFVNVFKRTLVSQPTEGKS
jgi:hypothetical protein